MIIITKEKLIKISLVISIIIIIIFNLWAIIINRIDLFGFLAIFSLVLTMIQQFSKITYGAEISIIKEKVEGTFFTTFGKAIIHPTPKISEVASNAFLGGSLRLSLTFHNKGDLKSLVTIKKAEIPNLNLEPVKIDESFNIEASSYYKYEFKNYFKTKGNIVPSKIDLLRLEYIWYKKEDVKRIPEDIQIICEIMPVT